MIVADLMTKDLVTVLPETSLADAARMMLARHLSGLLELDHAGALVGVIMSDEEHKAVRVIVEKAIGVMDVVDRLVFVDPGSGMAFPVGG